MKPLIVSLAAASLAAGCASTPSPQNLASDPQRGCILQTYTQIASSRSETPMAPASRTYVRSNIGVFEDMTKANCAANRAAQQSAVIAIEQRENQAYYPPAPPPTVFK